MVSVSVVKILIPIDFRVRLLGRKTIEIDRLLHLAIRIAQKRNQIRLKRDIQMSVRFFPVQKFVSTTAKP